jgi:class III poly(R)-hydroxyalkanoic acid synthase PhaE subunit
MSESNSWTDQWFNAQQQFVDSWTDMANASNTSSQKSQADLWAQSFEMWRKASGNQPQPDIQQAINKCVNMGHEYFAMAEQVSKAMSGGANPVDAINQWMEQLKQSLQQFSSLPGFDINGVNDFMKQWFAPNQSWQQMTAAFTPMNQAAWQIPGMNASVFNMGETIDPLGKVLEAPGVGYFREPQEKQQRGIQLAIEYHQANHAFNQAFLKVAMESIQGFQGRLLRLDSDKTPKSLRELYDLWVEISEEHYAEFAMSAEYQTLYGDMVNRLMTLKKHYAEITDDMLRAMNLPNTAEVDTMQLRLQQVRRENIVLHKEIDEIKEVLSTQDAPTIEADTMQQELQQLRQENTVLRKEIDNIKATLSKSANGAPAAVVTSAAAKVKSRPATRKKAPAKKTVSKTAVKKTAAKKKTAVSKASKGA